MQLIADRFLASASGAVVDLATGGPVVLRVRTAGGPTEQLRWVLRCDALYALRHRHLARLVDFGAVGEAERFEAWRCGARWRGSGAAASHARAVAEAFLRACGRGGGAACGDVVHELEGRAVVMPGDGAGHPQAEAETGPALPIEDAGYALVERSRAASLRELFESPPHRPQVVTIWGPEGSGRATMALEVMRAARVQGFVPLCADLIDLATTGEPFACRVLSHLRGRSTCIVVRPGRPWEPRMLDVALVSRRPHIILVLGAHEPDSGEGLALERFSPAALATMVRPSVLASHVAVRRAAERAGGFPGRFVAQLWPEAEKSATYGVARRPVRAAEQAVPYGGDGAIEATGARSDSHRWPTAARSDATSGRLQKGCELLARGRHAAAERELRQAVGALARRDQWNLAASGSLTLGRALVARGRAREALPVVDAAGTYARRGSDPSLLADAALLAGVASLELARLQEADAALGAALTAARAAGDERRHVEASVAVARSAFWQGRYDAADEVVGRAAFDGLDATVAVAVTAMASRTAVGRGCPDLAIERSARALERARASGLQSVVADACAAAAFAHLAVSDLEAASRHACAGTLAARASRDPLRAMRCRVLAAEAARRQGRRGEVSALVQRIRARTLARLPPILACRWSLLADLVALTGPVEDTVTRHVRASGLPALALFAPRPARGDPAPPVGAVLELLQLCQQATDDVQILTGICSRVRRELEAASVAFVAVHGGATWVAASEGARVDARIAERAVSAGIVVPPHRLDDRLEAAVPVRSGGDIVGALVARWTLGAPEGSRRGAATLELAAAMGATALAAVKAARRQASAESALGLVGEGPAMADVRRAIERAAQAPFAVLIEGESGSGKELAARALHRLSPRRDHALGTLNCAALPDELVESELFGHARGAFTGALTERTGVFEAAHLGTLLLDEVGELSPRAQAKLLRVVQEGEIRRIGENLSRRVDVRIVAATNRDLRLEAAAGRFRADLLYRLDVIRIVLPPLRDRRDDIALLVEHFWRDAAARVGSRATLATATVASLARYDWPGNVRELQNVLAALVVRSPKRGLVPPEALPPSFRPPASQQSCRLDQARRDFEERFVRAALVRTGGHRSRAATELGVTRQGLTKLLGRLGIHEKG